MIIPFYFLIGKYSRQKSAAIKYLLYSFAGGVIMLFGIVLLYIKSFATLGNSSEFFSYTFLAQKVIPTLDVKTTNIVFICLLIGLLIKAPMFPLHSWLNPVVSTSKIEISAFLVSIMDKMGTFGMLYILINIFPNQVKHYRNTVIIFAIISIIYSALVALKKDNVLSMIAFSSISHFGFIIIGIFSLTSVGIRGAKLYMIAHALSICGIFIIAKLLYLRTGTYSMSKMGGLQRKYLWLSFSYLIFSLSLIALPGTLTFPSELFVLLGAFYIHKIWVIFMLIGAVIGTVYILLSYQKIFTGKTIEKTQITKPNLSAKYTFAEQLVPFILVVLIIFFGICPNLLI
jgi:NADH-quinone oxidoreductase subunit M